MVAVPALATGQTADTPATADVVVTDYAFQDAAVTIAAGGTVNFSYPAGNRRHNIVFFTAQPTSCTQTAGAIWQPSPPLPWYQQGPGWAGSCRFDAPGVYEYHSGLDWNMRGSVTVVAASPSPSPSPTETPTSSPTATPTPTPTATPPARAGIVAHDTASPAKNWFQDAASADPADNSVTVAPGATVDFSFPAGSAGHNVVFATNPTSCVQKTGVAILPAPPLPQFALPAPWSGECTFNTPGTYTFVCSAHPVEMSGSVIVRDEGEPTPTPTPTVTPTPTPEPDRDATPAAVPKIWAAIDKPKTKNMTVARFLANKLKFTARCTSAGSGTLTLSVTKAVARRIGLEGTKLGAADATCDEYGRFTVKVKPSKKARDALEDYRRGIQATATLALAGPIGQTTATRTITLKGSKR
jgi:plastocyanin